MLASYVLDPGRRSHGLDVLALEFLDHAMTSYEDLCGRGRTQLPFDVVPVEAARDYSCEDADMTLRLRRHFEPQLEAAGLAELFRTMEVPLVGVLADMEAAGIAIDVAHFASLRERFKAERERLEREIYEEAGVEFNINSNLQLRQVLFEKLQLPVKKRTATGPSTDVFVLQELADEGHAIPQLLMEYRELFKLEGTYLEALPGAREPRDGAHPHVVQPDGGADRAAVVERPEPAEHPDPPRARPRHPPRLRAAQGVAGCSPPTTRRSSCGCSPTSPRTRRSSRRSARAATSTGRRRRSSSACRSTRSRARCATAPRRSTSRRSTGSGRSRCRGSSRSRTPRRGSSSTRTSSASRG
jgi:DNA polymerase-1